MLGAARSAWSDDQSRDLILDAGVPPGERAARILGIDEAVIEIGVTPNRGDCLSVRGVAREIAAVCGLGLAASFHGAVGPAAARRSSSRRASGRRRESCPLYTGIEVRDVARRSVAGVARSATARVRTADRSTTSST